MTVAVAIPTLGRDSLFVTLESLRRQTRMPDQLIIANQGDPDLRARVEAAWPGETTFLQQPERGVSKARNAAMAASRCDWTLWTDDDQEVNAEWVEQLEVVVRAFPHIGFCGGVVFSPLEVPEGLEPTDELHALGDTPITPESYRRPPVIHPNLQNDCWAGNFALSRECAERVGKFDEHFGRGSGFVDAGEDTDFVIRALSAGIEGLLTPRLSINHTHGLRKRGAPALDVLPVFGAILWKAKADPSSIRPELAERLRPYGQKKSALSRLTRGMAFAEHGHQANRVERMLHDMDGKFVMKNGCLAPKS
jgi:GT2 family glycosyltransferase